MFIFQSAVVTLKSRSRSIKYFKLFPISQKVSFQVWLKSNHYVRIRVRERAKIRNRYNQAPHLTQDINGKVVTTQLGITNESLGQPFPAGDHMAPINRSHNMGKAGLNSLNRIVTLTIILRSSKSKQCFILSQ